MSRCIKELKNFVEQKKKQKCSVAVLPDFFLDRLISLEWTPSEFSSLMEEVARRKGGSLDGIPQTDLHGGNAVNVASALANLGATVTPIVCTSQNGLQQMKYHFQCTALDTSHVKVLGKISVTTALEFKSKDEKTNVMIRDLGALADFGPDDLNENDYRVIDDANYTCLFNWAGTLRNGTRLAQAVFGRAKKLGKSKTYYDTADPTPNRTQIPDLMEKVLKSDLLDVLSVNENEAVTYASLLDDTLKDRKGQIPFAELAMEAARVLAEKVKARVDLHTTDFSATLKGKGEVVVPSFRVKALRATGAGDAWTAGNIIGDRNGLSEQCRLTLANAVAACYLSDLEGKHPTWEKLSDFLAKV